MAVKVIVFVTVSLLILVWSVDMWNFLGGLGGGLLNLVGGLFGQSNARSLTNQNAMFAQQAAQNSIQWRVQDAQKAGINPLAALGSNFQASAPTAVGSDALPNAFGAMGQNLSRAAQAYGDTLSKSAQLDNELKRAQIDQINAQTVAEQLRASKMVTQAQPGTPPGLGIVDASGNVARTVPPLFDEMGIPGKGKKITLLTPSGQQRVFSGIPTMPLMPWISAEMVHANLPTSPPPPMGSWDRYVPNFGNWDF